MTEFGVSSVANYELNSDHFKDVKGYEHYAGVATGFREVEARGSNPMAECFLREHCWGHSGDVLLAKSRKSTRCSTRRKSYSRFTTAR